MSDEKQVVENVKVYKPFSDNELTDLRRAVDEISLAAVDEHIMGRLFATIDGCDAYIAGIRGRVVEMEKEIARLCAILHDTKDLKRIIDERDALKRDLFFALNRTPHLTGEEHIDEVNGKTYHRCLCGAVNEPGSTRCMNAAHWGTVEKKLVRENNALKAAIALLKAAT
jgi:hypothetical protein